MFQKSVINEFLKNQDEKLLSQRWAKFQDFKSKIEDIKDFIETSYQDGFLEDIFVSCLGYTLKTKNPKDYNLEREKKNETNSKRADGVIYLNSEVIGVIELKDKKTKSLDSVVEQAFSYLHQNSKAKYVIISNFDELRFYIEKSVSYEKFSLFNMDYGEFKKLHLLLSYENIKSELPLKLKEKSNSFEQDISKKFYKLFSSFRLDLFDDIVKNNSNFDKHTLLRATQKLCDRIIFILFAEDKGLLKADTIKAIREDFKNQKFTNYTLYDIYKFYFDGINKGNEKLEIPKYNGGLFAKDLLLDSLIIGDTILDERVQELSKYDFLSEISVNILGHIFEQSLTDLEELQANLSNENFDKKQSKRKKDGVFYTPEPITKYIVENTLGKMCKEKREALNIENVVSPKNLKKLTQKEQEQKENLQEYKTWLFNLKILDPACGSGAFLNQALEFLINEHKILQNDFALMGDLFASYQVEEAILENNLYGVDINEDAVEIAKLSLWLRTAQKGRVLTKLSDKIVCANSLLSMPFAENSFDIVIGNPPYVRVQGLKSNYIEETKLYEEKFISATRKYDIYVLFMESGFKMLKSNGKLSYILPHKFLVSDFGSGIRKFLLENKAIESLLHFGSEMVFEDASTYTCIVTLSHNNNELKFKSISPKDIFNSFDYDVINYDKLSSNKWNLSSNEITKVLEKINKQPQKIKDVFRGIYQGIVSGDNKAFYLTNCYEDENFIYGKNELFNENIKIEKDLAKKILNGKTIKRYEIEYKNDYIIYPYKLINNKTVLIEENQLKSNFPFTYNFLYSIYERLSNRGSTNMKYPMWYSLWNFRNINNQKSKKILTPDICFKSNMYYDENSEYFYNDTAYALILKDNSKEDYKFYLAILNSSLMWFYLANTSSELRGGYFRFKTSFVEPFPLPKLENIKEQEPFIKLVDNILEAKQKIKDYKTLLDEAISNNNFDREIALKKELEKLENICKVSEESINNLVYNLYNLTADEIKIIENI